MLLLLICTPKYVCTNIDIRKKHFLEVLLSEFPALLSFSLMRFLRNYSLYSSIHFRYDSNLNREYEYYIL